MSEETLPAAEEHAELPPWLPVAGLAIGFLGALCGIGGGLFAVPLLHYVCRFELRTCVATGLVLVFATTSSSTVTELVRGDFQMPWGVIGALVAGVLVGAQLGFRLSQRMPVRTWKAVFAVVLTVAGLRILFGSPPPPSDELVTELGALALGNAALTGLLGGFVAPLLGVGGGLFMVPGLYLGPTGLDFVGARACSLAAGAVGSARSLRLHAKTGRVRWAHGLALAAGALGGAAVGVYAVRLPILADVARWLLGVLLVITALRFARDWRRG